MVPRLDIVIRRFNRPELERHFVGVSPDCPEGGAEFNVWLRCPNKNGTMDELFFTASQVDSVRRPRSFKVLLRGPLQVGDSIEVKIAKDAQTI